jgi:hypothetical protein
MSFRHVCDRCRKDVPDNVGYIQQLVAGKLHTWHKVCAPSSEGRA